MRGREIKGGVEKKGKGEKKEELFSKGAENRQED